MIQAGVVGASGYAGFEMVRLLAAHPEVELRVAVSRSQAGRSIADLYPTPLDVPLTSPDDFDPTGLDVLFLALPHTAAAGAAARALEAGCRVVDLSADFRLDDAESYARWYGQTHPHPELLDRAVYGLTEWARERLADAILVANPGCYPTSILLALGPLLEAGLLAGVTVIADSKSGTSGAGRKAAIGSLFAEVSEDTRPYAVGYRHRHAIEIEQQMVARAEGYAPSGIVFSPHLIPVTRGLLSTIYVPMPDGWSEAQLRALYLDRFADEPFLWLLPEGQTATIRHVARTNRAAVSLHPVPERGQLVVVGVIDNLLKGASGQALQNMNVMVGLDERMGLD